MLTRVLILLLLLVPPTLGEEAIIRVRDTVRLHMPVPDGNISNFYRVDDSGKIELPFIGGIKVAGLTCNDAAQAIDDSYLTKGLTSRRMATVSIGGPEPFLSMMGEFKSPGRVAFRPAVTLLEAIKEVGGFTEAADRKYVKMERAADGKVYTIDVTKILNKPDLDIFLLAGDKVRVTALQK